MKKKFKLKKVFVMLLALLLSISMQAGEYIEDVSINELRYSLYNDGTAVLVKCQCSSPNIDFKVDIPESVTHNDRKYIVTSIAPNVFSYYTFLTSVTVPASVTSIGKSAFDNCTALTSISIPNSVTSIGEYAFRNCTAMASATISNSMTNISLGTFSGCINLSSIIFGSSITVIGQNAFKDCYSLTSVIIPNSVTEISTGAFENCKEIASIKLSENLVIIFPGAFKECKKLVTIEIPKSVASIMGAFSGCTGLKRFIVAEDNPYYTSYEDVLFNKDKTILIAYPNLKSSNYIIPSGVKSVELVAFGGCMGLTSLTVPESMSNFLRGDELKGCTNLKLMKVFYTIPPECTNFPSDEIYENCTLYVPMGTKQAYQLHFVFRRFKRIEERIDKDGFTNFMISSLAQGKGKILINDHEAKADTLREGSKVLIKFTPDKKYMLNKAYIGNKDITSELKENAYMVDSIYQDMSVKAEFELKKYDVTATFNSGGKVLVNDAEVTTVSMTDGEPVTFKVIPEDEFRIGKAILNDKNIKEELKEHTYKIDSIGSDLKLNVEFEQYKWRVTSSYDKIEGTVILNKDTLSDIGYVEKGRKAEFRVIPKIGYVVNNVTLDDKNITSDLVDGTYSLSSVNERHSISVLFKEMSYNVSVSYESTKGSVTLNDKDITTGALLAGQRAVFKFTPKEGYYTSKLLVNGNDVTGELSDNLYIINSVSENLIIGVEFKAATFSVSAIYNKEEGLITINNQDVNSLELPINSKAEFRITPKNGYYIDKVDVNNVDKTTELTSDGTYTINSINQNIVLEARFKKYLNVTVKYDKKQGAVRVNNVEEGPFAFRQETSVEFMILPKRGYNIRQVSLNGEDVTSELKDDTFYEIEKLIENVEFEVEFADENSISKNQTATVKIYSLSDKVIIENASERELVLINDIAGQTVYQGTDREIALDKGIYIVKVSNITQKVVM